MTTMYDSVTPSAIPSDALIVAGYIDGRYAWTADDWARFPKAEKVRIAVFSSNDDGRVLDVERGDATPVEAPVWVAIRRRSTAHPLSGPATVYCNASTWPAVRAAFIAAKVAEPDYWIADYDNIAEVPAGAVAKQYQSLTSPNIDISITVASWPVAPPAPKPTPEPSPKLTADEYAAAHGMVQIDHKEAQMCVFPGLRPTAAGRAYKAIAWYEWVDGAMASHSDGNIPVLAEGEHLYAYLDVITPAGIPHAGA